MLTLETPQRNSRSIRFIGDEDFEGDANQVKILNSSEKDERMKDVCRDTSQSTSILSTGGTNMSTTPSKIFSTPYITTSSQCFPAIVAPSSQRLQAIVAGFRDTYPVILVSVSAGGKTSYSLRYFEQQTNSWAFVLHPPRDCVQDGYISMQCVSTYENKEAEKVQGKYNRSTVPGVYGSNYVLDVLRKGAVNVSIKSFDRNKLLFVGVLRPAGKRPGGKIDVDESEGNGLYLYVQITPPYHHSPLLVFSTPVNRDHEQTRLKDFCANPKERNRASYFGSLHPSQCLRLVAWNDGFKLFVPGRQSPEEIVMACETKSLPPPQSVEIIDPRLSIQDQHLNLLIPHTDIDSTDPRLLSPSMVDVDDVDSADSHLPSPIDVIKALLYLTDTALSKRKVREVVPNRIALFQIILGVLYLNPIKTYLPSAHVIQWSRYEWARNAIESDSLSDEAKRDAVVKIGTTPRDEPIDAIRTLLNPGMIPGAPDTLGSERDAQAQAQADLSLANDKDDLSSVAASTFVEEEALPAITTSANDTQTSIAAGSATKAVDSQATEHTPSSASTASLPAAVANTGGATIVGDFDFAALVLPIGHKPGRGSVSLPEIFTSREGNEFPYYDVSIGHFVTTVYNEIKQTGLQGICATLGNSAAPCTNFGNNSLKVAIIAEGMENTSDNHALIKSLITWATVLSCWRISISPNNPIASLLDVNTGYFAGDSYGGYSSSGMTPAMNAPRIFAATLARNKHETSTSISPAPIHSLSSFDTLQPTEKLNYLNFLHLCFQTKRGDMEATKFHDFFLFQEVYKLSVEDVASWMGFDEKQALHFCLYSHGQKKSSGTSQVSNTIADCLKKTFEKINRIRTNNAFILDKFDLMDRFSQSCGRKGESTIRFALGVIVSPPKGYLALADFLRGRGGLVKRLFMYPHLLIDGSCFPMLAGFDAEAKASPLFGMPSGLVRLQWYCKYLESILGFRQSKGQFISNLRPEKWKSLSGAEKSKAIAEYQTLLDRVLGNIQNAQIDQRLEMTFTFSLPAVDDQMVDRISLILADLDKHARNLLLPDADKTSMALAICFVPVQIGFGKLFASTIMAHCGQNAEKVKANQQSVSDASIANAVGLSAICYGTIDGHHRISASKWRIAGIIASRSFGLLPFLRDFFNGLYGKRSKQQRDQLLGSEEEEEEVTLSGPVIPLLKKFLVERSDVIRSIGNETIRLQPALSFFTNLLTNVEALRVSTFEVDVEAAREKTVNDLIESATSDQTNFEARLQHSHNAISNLQSPAQMKEKKKKARRIHRLIRKRAREGMTHIALTKEDIDGIEGVDGYVSDDDDDDDDDGDDDGDVYNLNSSDHSDDREFRALVDPDDHNRLEVFTQLDVQHTSLGTSNNGVHFVKGATEENCAQVNHNHCFKEGDQVVDSIGGLGTVVKNELGNLANCSCGSLTGFWKIAEGFADCTYVVRNGADVKGRTVYNTMKGHLLSLTASSLTTSLHTRSKSVVSPQVSLDFTSNVQLSKVQSESKKRKLFTRPEKPDNGVAHTDTPSMGRTRSKKNKTVMEEEEEEEEEEEKEDENTGFNKRKIIHKAVTVEHRKAMLKWAGHGKGNTNLSKATSIKKLEEVQITYRYMRGSKIKILVKYKDKEQYLNLKTYEWTRKKES